ncbi:MAG: hypothetical protein ABR505_08840 [Actinomycetota bacterium]
MKRAALIVLIIMQVLAALISISVFFVEEAERFESDANVLISTFGVGMAFFGLVLTVLADRGSRAGWTALWYWPIFFVIHVAALQTYVPDLVFALIWVGGLLLMRPEPGATSAPT